MAPETLLYGKYEPLARLGSGGMGEVYKVRRQGPEGFSRELALKRILPEAAGDPRALQLFLREARALASLNHRGIVQIFELGVADGGGAYLVMELLDGLTLFELIRRAGALPWEAVAHIGAELAHALSAAHALRQDGAPNGLVHGDLSPSNAIACRDGAVKLLDFGLTRPVGFEPSSSRLVGKLPYLAPESIAGVSPTPGFDVYGLGVTLYELVTGARLFRGQNELQTVHLILHEERPRPSSIVPSIPPELDAILLRAVSRDCQQRLGTVELATALEQLSHGRFGPRQLAELVAVHHAGTPSAAAADGGHFTLATSETDEATRKRLAPRRAPRRALGLLASAAVALAAGAVLVAASGKGLGDAAPSEPPREALPAAPAVQAASGTGHGGEESAEPHRQAPPAARAMQAVPTPTPASPSRHRPVRSKPRPRGDERAGQRPAAAAEQELSPGFLANPFKRR